MTVRALTAEHRAKLSAAKRGKTHTPEHNAAISAGVRKVPHPQTVLVARIMAELDEDEQAEYRRLMRSLRKTRADALHTLGRQDLIELLPKGARDKWLQERSAERSR